MADDEATNAIKAADGSEDFLLQELVQTANQHGGQFDVTLTVGGLLVTGIVVGGKEYFDGIANEARSATNGGWNGFTEVFEQIGSDIYRSGDEDGDDVGPLPLFIHLKDARFIYPGVRPVPANRGVYWGGRISAVDSFCFGTLSAVEQ